MVEPDRPKVMNLNLTIKSYGTLLRYMFAAQVYGHTLAVRVYGTSRGARSRYKFAVQVELKVCGTSLRYMFTL